jgi:hypothetical protein
MMTRAVTGPFCHSSAVTGGKCEGAVGAGEAVASGIAVGNVGGVGRLTVGAGCTCDDVGVGAA